jgi:hypothetical protein
VRVTVQHSGAEIPTCEGNKFAHRIWIFFPCRIPELDPGIKKAPGSRIWIRNTGKAPVPFCEIRRAHFLRTHNVTEISGGLATVPVG